MASSESVVQKEVAGELSRKEEETRRDAKLAKLDVARKELGETKALLAINVQEIVEVSRRVVNSLKQGEGVMASSESDVREKVAVGEGDGIDASSPLEAVSERVEAAIQPEDPQTIISRFRQRHDEKLTALEAARKEADEIDALVAADLIKISGIAERIKANRAEMERLHKQYNPKKTLQESGNGLLAVFNPINLVSGAWGALPALNLFGSTETVEATAQGQRDLSVDSTHGAESDGDTVPEGSQAQRQPAVQPAMAGSQSYSAYTEGLQRCGSTLKEISGEERAVNESIVNRRRALVENIERQQRVFKELLEIVFGYLEAQIDVDKAQDKDLATVALLQRLREAVPAALAQQGEKTLAVESLDVRALEHRRAGLRTAKQAFLELLLSFVARNNDSGSVDAVTGAAATMLAEYAGKSVFQSPQKQIGIGVRAATAAEEPLATDREVKITALACQSARERQTQTLIPPANVSIDEEALRALEEKIRQQERERIAVEARAEESRKLAEQNAAEVQQWKKVGLAMKGQVVKLSQQNTLLTTQLQDTTQELIRTKTALQSMRASVVQSGIQTPFFSGDVEVQHRKNGFTGILE